MSTAKNANTWKINKDKLGDSWAFADNEEYKTFYSSSGKMICVQFDLMEEIIVSHKAVKISLAVNKEGTTKLFPYDVDGFMEDIDE